MTRLHEVNIEMLTTAELHALINDAALELDKRGEDNAQWLSGFDAGERMAMGDGFI